MAHTIRQAPVAERFQQLLDDAQAVAHAIADNAIADATPPDPAAVLAWRQRLFSINLALQHACSVLR